MTRRFPIPTFDALPITHCEHGIDLAYRCIDCIEAECDALRARVQELERRQAMLPSDLRVIADIGFPATAERVNGELEALRHDLRKVRELVRASSILYQCMGVLAEDHPKRELLMDTLAWMQGTRDEKPDFDTLLPFDAEHYEKPAESHGKAYDLLKNAPAMLEALELLVGDKYQAVEHNPEDGARCFYCGGPLKVLWHEDSYLEHEMDCDFVKARAVLARVKGDAE